MSLRAAGASLAAILASAALIALLVFALGASPAVVAGALAEGAFGNSLACSDTLVKATPLLFCGLAVALSFEASIWNIGAEGQLITGALLAGALGPALGSWPHSVALCAILLAGVWGGALCGAIAGWLRARRDVSEIISTIMLNFAAAQLLSWAVHGPLIEPSHAFPKSAPIATPAQLHFYFEPSRLNFGMLLAVLLALAVYLLLFHTALGFKLRAVGRNPRAAAWFGIPAGRLSLTALTLSGGLAGLGGAVQVSAITHRLYETISPGWGYEAIAVALVARLNPLAIIPAAIFFGALDNGAQAMQRSAGVAPELVQVIEGLVIVVLLALDSKTLRSWWRVFTPAVPVRETIEGEARSVADA
jgi:simple sugar transport system permease protein